jgi:hypothetical protein
VTSFVIMDDTTWSYWLNATRERKPGHPRLYPPFLPIVSALNRGPEW